MTTEMTANANSDMTTELLGQQTFTEAVQERIGA